MQGLQKKELRRTKGRKIRTEKRETKLRRINQGKGRTETRKENPGSKEKEVDQGRNAGNASGRARKEKG